MSEMKNVGYTWMALNTFKRNRLTPLHYKGLTTLGKLFTHVPLSQSSVITGQSVMFCSVAGR